MTFTDLMSKVINQITMNLHRFDVKTIKNVELRRKTFKTAKLQKWSKWLSPIWCQKLQNNKMNLNIDWCSKSEQSRKWSNYDDEFARFDVANHSTANVEVSRKTFKTTQNNKSDQITMNLHRFDVKTI